MGQGGPKDRLAKSDAAARIRGSAPQVGGREDLLMAGPEQEDEQGLRATVRQCRGVHLRGDDTADGEAIGTCLRLSKQFRKGNSPKFGLTEFLEVSPARMWLGSQRVRR